ncbi:hypothetical protein BDZ45DRAFT_748024 [Acephala macrosclerotiorum]|nr:hypothetical protein BDZ45DRAFT_748024 [Acephala macrosclerotiorum]
MASGNTKQSQNMADGLFGPTAPGIKAPKFARDEPATPPWIIGSSTLRKNVPNSRVARPAAQTQSQISAVAVAAAKHIVNSNTIFLYALIGAALAATGYYSYPTLSSAATSTAQNVNEGIKQAFDAVISAQATWEPTSSSPTLSLAPTIAPNGVEYCSPPNDGYGCSTVTSGDKASPPTPSPDFTILPVTDANEAANTFKSSESEIVKSTSSAQPISSSSVATSSASRSTSTSPSRRTMTPKITATGNKSLDRLLTLYVNLSSILPEDQILRLSKSAVTAHQFFWHGAEDARRLNTPQEDAEWTNKVFQNLMLHELPEVLSACLQMKKENFVFETDIKNILALPDNQALGTNLLSLHTTASGWKDMLAEIDSILEEFEGRIDRARPVLEGNVHRVEQRWEQNLKREFDASWFKTPAYAAKLQKDLDMVRDKLEMSGNVASSFLDTFAADTQTLRASINAGLSTIDNMTSNRKWDEKLAKKGAEVDGAVLENALVEFVEQRKTLEAAQVQLRENVATSKSYNGKKL